MEGTKARLMQYFKNQGFKLTSVVKNISVSEKYFSTKSAISSDILEKVCEKYPDLNMDWVITGRGEMIYKTETKMNTPLPFGKILDNILSFHKISKAALVEFSNGHLDLNRIEQALKFTNQIDHKILLYIDKFKNTNYLSSMYGAGQTKHTKIQEKEMIDHLRFICEYGEINNTIESTYDDQLPSTRKSELEQLRAEVDDIKKNSKEK